MVLMTIIWKISKHWSIFQFTILSQRQIFFTSSHLWRETIYWDKNNSNPNVIFPQLSEYLQYNNNNKNGVHSSPSQFTFAHVAKVSLFSIVPRFLGKWCSSPFCIGLLYVDVCQILVVKKERQKKSKVLYCHDAFIALSKVKRHFRRRRMNRSLG